MKVEEVVLVQASLYFLKYSQTMIDSFVHMIDLKVCCFFCF